MLNAKTASMIPTKNSEGESTGWLLPIWNSTEEMYRPDQVYLTVVDAGAMKGPHLHMTRAGRFTCIRGDVKIVTRLWDKYTETLSGDSGGYKSVYIPAGTACAIYNIGQGQAYVLNLVTPSWTAENQDDHPVVDWQYQP